MKFKQMVCFVLTALLALSLAACSGGGEPSEPPVLRDDFASMTDDQVMEALLSRYTQTDFSVLSYSVSLDYALGGRVIQSLTGDFLRKHQDQSVDLTVTTVAGSQQVKYTYVSGVFYLQSDGEKGKFSASPEEVAQAFEQPGGPESFDSAVSYGSKTLLRSEDGSFHVVLELPVSSAVLDLPQSSEDEGEEGEDTLELIRIEDSYVTLTFTAEGIPAGVSFGTDAWMNVNGEETLLRMTLETQFRSFDPVQVGIPVPLDADSYEVLEENPFLFEEETTDSSSDASEDESDETTDET